MILPPKIIYNYKNITNKININGLFPMPKVIFIFPLLHVYTEKETLVNISQYLIQIIFFEIICKIC